MYIEIGIDNISFKTLFIADEIRETKYNILLYYRYRVVRNG